MTGCGSRSDRCPSRRPGPAPACACRPAGSAAPTCTCSTARSTIAQPPRVLGHQIVGSRRRDGRRVGVPWLGWTCGACAYCRAGRENLCDARPLHRPRHRRRVRRVRRRRRALLLPAPGRLPRRAGRAAVVRRADRLSRAARCAATPPARPLRLRRRGPYPRPGRALARAASLRVHAPRRRAAQRFARELGAVWADPRAPPSRWTPRSSSPRRARSCRRARRRRRRAARVVCGGIHMSDIPAFPYELLWHERSGPLGRQPDARATARSSSRSRRSVPVRTHVTRTRSSARQRRWTICAPGGSPARRSWCPLGRALGSRHSYLS